MINLDKIEAVIFDLGGVILNIDYNLTIKAFEKLGFQDFKEQYSQARQSGLFDLLETGKMEPNQFVEEIQKINQKRVSEEQVLQAWNAMLLDFPSERLELLKKVNAKFKTFLLSNTNKIHMEAYNALLQKEFNIPSLDPYFEKVYLSHEIGLRKPDKEVFEYVLNEQNLTPEKTLFIDDSKQHIYSAQELGIQVYWLTGNDDVLHLFNNVK